MSADDTIKGGRKPPPVVVGLKRAVLKTKAPATGPKWTSTAKRPSKKRVFSEDDWNKLNGMTTKELYWRIEQGKRLIGLLHHPSILNMTQKEADMRSSNLRYQIEAIKEIIDSRSEEESGLILP